jgi:hypothetical protein
MDNLPIPNDQLTLKELVAKAKEWKFYLFSKGKIIIFTISIGILFGLSYSLIKKPIYTATLSFALEDENAGSELVGAFGLANSLGFDIGGGGGGMFTGSNLTVLFKSRNIVEQTLLTSVQVNGKVISLAEMYIQNNKWRKNWNDTPKFKNVQFLPESKRQNFTRVQDSILGVIYENLYKDDLVVAQKDEKIAVISIDFFSKNEMFAKYFVEALSEKVSDFYIMTKSKKAKRNMDILKIQTDSVRRVLSGAITGLAIAHDNVFGLNPTMDVRRVPSAIRQVDVQANTAILTELVKQTELAKVTLRKETPLIQVIDRPIFPLHKETFGKFKGMAIGGFLSGFLIVFWLIMRRIISQL